MESSYDRKKVSMLPLRYTCKRKGVNMAELSVRMGYNKTFLNGVAGGRLPATGLLARICSELECPVTDVVRFKDIEIREQFKEPRLFIPPVNPQGVVSYAPLIDTVMNMYMWEPEKKTIQDFFDTLPRGHWKNEESIKKAQENVRKALTARGYDESVIGNAKRKRYTTGLTYDTRRRIMHDEPVRLAVIYDICKALGCTPDYVVTYK